MKLGFARASLLLVLSFSIAQGASAQSPAGSKQQLEAATPIVSYFPQKDLGLFLAANFDLASIRSSFGPRRTPTLRTFTDFGMKPSTATENALIFDQPGGWLYALRIVGRRDVNSDGVEDLNVCFVDRAQNGGTYHTSHGLLVTRYSNKGFALALSFPLNPRLCVEYGGG